MKLPPNVFKRRLAAGEQMIGLWSMLCSPVAAEALGYSGFDWILIDGEHAPNELPGVIAQLNALGAGTAAPIVRLAANDVVLFKRHLDAGAHTLMVPMVQTPAEARAAVSATRYAPSGIRGLAAMHRSSRFGRIPDYVEAIEHEICLIVQIETARGLDNLEAICGVDGIDAVFFGPADLAASLGHAGRPAHPEVQRLILEAHGRCRAVGKPAGALAPNDEIAETYLSAGFAFVSVANDLALLCRQSDRIAERFRGLVAAPGAVSVRAAGE